MKEVFEMIESKEYCSGYGNLRDDPAWIELRAMLDNAIIKAPSAERDVKISYWPIQTDQA